MASPDPSSCPAGSKIGSGKLTALTGSAGQPTSDASPCSATLSLYAAGKGHATLFVGSKLGECPVALSQAIDMQYVSKGELAGRPARHRRDVHRRDRGVVPGPGRARPVLI